MTYVNLLALKKEFPDGYVMPIAERRRRGLSDSVNYSRPGIQCGEYVRLLTGYKGGNLSPMKAKLALLEKGRKPQPGDIGVMGGGEFGHIFYVLGVAPKEGYDELYVTDANAFNDSVIRYRTIKSTQCAGFAFIGSKEEYTMVKAIPGIVESTLDPRDHVFQTPATAQMKSWDVPFFAQGDMPDCQAVAICNALFAITGIRYAAGALYTLALEKYHGPDSKPLTIPIRDAMWVLDNIGIPVESQVPYGEPWGEDREDRLARWREQLSKLDRTKFTKFKYFKIPKWYLKKADDALHFTSPLIVAVDTFRGWDEGLTPPANGSLNHATTVVRKVNNDTYAIMDSLESGKTPKGEGLLHRLNMYEIWGIGNMANSTIEPVSTYGQRVDYAKELKAEADIIYAIGKIKRKDFTEEFVANQKAYVYAVAYGGYTASNWIGGVIWTAGDIMHYMKNKIEGSPLPFDLSKKK